MVLILVSSTHLPPLYLHCVYSTTTTTTTTPLVLPRIVLVYGAYSLIYCTSIWGSSSIRRCIILTFCIVLVYDNWHIISYTFLVPSDVLHVSACIHIHMHAPVTHPYHVLSRCATLLIEIHISDLYMINICTLIIYAGMPYCSSIRSSFYDILLSYMIMILWIYFIVEYILILNDDYRMICCTVIWWYDIYTSIYLYLYV